MDDDVLKTLEAVRTVPVLRTSLDCVELAWKPSLVRTSSPVDWSRFVQVDKALPTSLHYQLRENLRAAIADLAPDVQIPSEKAIQEMAGVSRQTARRSISDLVHEGLLRSEQGKGTFSVGRRVDTHLGRPRGFTETIERAGHRASTRLISVEITEVNDSIAQQLHLPDGAEVFRLERLRFIDDIPSMLELSHIPVHLAPELDRADLTASLYENLANLYGIHPTGGTEVINATAANHSLAELFDISVGAPLLTTVRTALDEHHRPFEFTIRHARADVCSFSVTLAGGSILTRRTDDIPA